MNWLTRPIELPPSVQRLLPKSWVRFLSAVAILGFWFRPNLDVWRHAGYLAAWRIWDIFPANLTVPVTAAILLVAAWRGYRKIELWSVLGLWLHALILAIFVPLGATTGASGILLALYIAMMSALHTLLVARRLSGEPQLIDAAQLRSEIRRAVILGCGVAMLAFILLFPVFISEAAHDRESNRLYAGLERALGLTSASVPVRASSPVTAPATNSQPAPTVAQKEAPLIAPFDVSEEDSAPLSAAQRCRLVGEVPDEIVGTTQQAWLKTVNEQSRSREDIVGMRRHLFQGLVDRYLKPSATSWLSVTLPALRDTAAASRLLTTTLPSDSNLMAPPNIDWTRPIVQQALERYSVKHSGRDRSAAEPEADSQSEEGESEPEVPLAVSVFPIDVECSMLGFPNSPATWVYPMAGTTSAVPQLETPQGDGRVLVKLPLASIERVASIVDFARFVDVAISVTLAPRETTEVVPGEPDESWRGLSWGVELTANLPLLAVAGDQLVPGRLVHARGEDACVADSSIDILLDHPPGESVTGILLLANSSLGENMAVLSVQSEKRAHDQLRSSRAVTLVDLTGYHQPDVVFEAVRYEVPWTTDDGKEKWVAGPWSWVGVASAKSRDEPFDRVPYPGCGRL